MKLTFSKNERVGIISLITLVLLLFLFSIFYKGLSSERYDLSGFEDEVAAFEQGQRRLADSAAAARMAHRERYKSRYEQIYPQKEKFKSSFAVYDNDTGFRRKEKIIRYDIVKLDINSCDSSDLVVVPQFGAKRSSKLVEYREKLGGFYSFEQLAEVFVLQNIKLSHLEKFFYIDRNKIRKLKVNEATYRELVSHPYFDAYMAKLVLNYRDRYGKITSIEEFRKCTNAYPELIERLAPYLSFE